MMSKDAMTLKLDYHPMPTDEATDHEMELFGKRSAVHRWKAKGEIPSYASALIRAYREGYYCEPAALSKEEARHILRGLTQREAAKVAGCSKASIANASANGMKCSLGSANQILRVLQKAGAFDEARRAKGIYEEEAEPPPPEEVVPYDTHGFHFFGREPRYARLHQVGGAPHVGPVHEDYAAAVECESEDIRRVNWRGLRTLEGRRYVEMKEGVVGLVE